MRRTVGDLCDNLGQKVHRGHFEFPVRRLGGTPGTDAGFDYQRLEVIGIDHARNAIVAYISGPENADRQSSIYGRPHQAFGHPFCLVVTSLHPVYEAVYIVVFQVRVGVASREDAVGGNVLDRLCFDAASEFDHFQRPVDGVGFSRRIGIGVVDGGRAVKDQVNLFGKLLIFLSFQSQKGLGEVPRNWHDPVLKGLTGQPVVLQSFQYPVGWLGLSGSPVPCETVKPGILARRAQQFVKQKRSKKAGCPSDQDRRCFAQSCNSRFARRNNLRVQLCVVAQRSS